ncbi:hypothetical protein vBBcePLY3_00045 [Bacillus phage vB_BceP_LY3]|uniref:Uncharacterized protein n=1 Tax=Bacillus phage vB_BceP_LY3 TaxID=2950458 RepID=A0AAE9S217_9CAUD|nr:hypothetical protein vBBcePLY3_00045 [Bacillus phage vB_BceP_LY3]
MESTISSNYDERNDWIMNNNNYDKFDNYIINNTLNQGNRLKRMEVEEQRLMRKAYCKVNNIPYEEPQEIPSFGKGLLKVSVLVIWLFIIGMVLSILWSDSDFFTFLGGLL